MKNEVKEKLLLISDYYQQLQFKTLKKTHLIKQTKKEIARILTQDNMKRRLENVTK